MDRDETLELLRLHQPELRRLGVKSLALFGSIARNEGDLESDVDILVDFVRPATFDAYMDVRFYLEDLLHRKVDLVTPQAIRPSIAPSIRKDLIYVP